MSFLLWGLLGVGAYFLWWSYPGTSAPGSAPSPSPSPGSPLPYTSPTLYAAASNLGPVPQPLPSGLPYGWYWEDQSNSALILLGDSVRAIAMSPDDIPTVVFGTAVDTTANITFQVSSPSNAATGLMNGQAVTLPPSFVALA
jgi:hypothetical protein